jgi:membrane associated rhomboid family serine protease/HSP20 family molecular chaperone IbpA
MFPLYDENRPLTRPYVNYVLIAINVFVFLLQIFGFMGLDMGVWDYGSIPEDLLAGERPWTLFTSMFMHGGIQHILGNMVFLWIFGDNIEDSLGHAKYLAFYLLGGVLATFAHIASTLFTASMVLDPYFTPALDIPSLGASGAISGVLGAYFLLYPRAKIRTLVFYFYIVTVVRIPAFYYLGFWFVYQLLFGAVSLFGASSQVAFWAHIGGYIFGMAAVKLLDVKPRMVLPRGAARERPMRPVRPITAPWVIKPLVDILVGDDAVTVFANIPGVEDRDIKIGVSQWGIEVSAEYRDIKFYRQVALSVPVMPTVQNRMYRNGVLSFTLPRIR